METFKIENIKIPPIKVSGKLNKETGLLKLRTEVMGTIYEEIAELNSKAIRESLIEMGWTPPETGAALNDAIGQFLITRPSYDEMLIWQERFGKLITQTCSSTD